MTSGVLVQLVLTLVGGGGAVGAVVALFKLRPDMNSAAVTQSQNAMETMAQLNASLEKDRDAWRDRALAAEKALAQLQRRRGGSTSHGEPA